MSPQYELSKHISTTIQDSKMTFIEWIKFLDNTFRQPIKVLSDDDIRYLITINLQDKKHE